MRGFVDNYSQSSQGSTGRGASNHDSYISMEAIALNLDANHQPQVENGHNDLRLVMTIECGLLIIILSRVRDQQVVVPVTMIVI